MIIIKIILWSLLAVLLLAAIALSIPVKIQVKYSDDVSLFIKYLFLSFPIDIGGSNAKKTSKKKKRKKTIKSVSKNKIKTTENKNSSSDNTKNAEEADDNEKEKENATLKWLKKASKQRGLKGLINVLKELAKLAETFFKPIFKHIVIKRLDMNITIASEDAADTAIRYGYACSGIYPSLAVLLGIMKYDDYSVNINPDFDKKKTELDILAEVSVIPWFIAFGSVQALVNYINLKYKEII